MKRARLTIAAIVVALTLIVACGGQSSPLLAIYPARPAEGGPGAPAGWERVSFRTEPYEVADTPIVTTEDFVGSRKSHLHAGALELDLGPAGVAALQDYVSNGQQLVAFKFRGRLSGFATTASLTPSEHVYVKDLLQLEIQALIEKFK